MNELFIPTVVQCEVAAEIPSQPPPVSEYGVVGSDPAAVQFITLCLEYLGSHRETAHNLLEVWRQNLNEFTMKSAVEVSIEFKSEKNLSITGN